MMSLERLHPAQVKRSWLAPAGWTTLGIGTLLAAWELIGQIGLVPRSSLPGPLSVIQALPTLIVDDSFQSGVVSTVKGWSITVALGSAAAVLVGLVSSSVTFLQRGTETVVDVFRAVPATALIPIAILLFGLGLEMKVAVALYGIFWPILINTIYGIAATDPMRIDVARSLRWSWLRTQLCVVLPSALPSVLTGIRVGVSIGLIVIISAELLGARSGVGTVLVVFSQADRPDAVYAGVLLVGTAGAAVFSLLVRAERRLVRWTSVV